MEWYSICAKKLLKLLHECVIITRIVHGNGTKLGTQRSEELSSTRNQKTHLMFDAHLANDLIEQPRDVHTTVLAFQNTECEEEVASIHVCLADLRFRLLIFDSDVR